MSIFVQISWSETKRTSIQNKEDNVSESFLNAKKKIQKVGRQGQAHSRTTTLDRYILTVIVSDDWKKMGKVLPNTLYKSQLAPSTLELRQQLLRRERGRKEGLLHQNFTRLLLFFFFLLASFYPFYIESVNKTELENAPVRFFCCL